MLSRSRLASFACFKSRSNALTSWLTVCRASRVKLVELPQKDLSGALVAGVPVNVLQMLFEETEERKPHEGCDLLNEMCAELKRYLSMVDEEAVCAALRTMHTHCAQVAAYTPYLSIFSRERDCCKSRLMTVLEFHAANPLRAVTASSSSIVRAIELWKLTFFSTNSTR
jgi:hypothetical protein